MSRSLFSWLMIFALVVTSAAVAVTTTRAQETDDIEAPPPIEGHLLMPERLDPTQELFDRLALPEGFTFEVFADGLAEEEGGGGPRKIAVGPDDTVYATRRDRGDVIALFDRDGDGISDEMEVLVEGLEYINGIHINDGQVYLVTDTVLYVTDLQDDGTFGELQVIVDDLPDAGQHPNRVMAFGPDGMLYISIGSTCNSCEETNPEAATMLRMNADGSGREIYAEGLRNTVGFDWHPDTDQLWGMDMGSDWRGNDDPPEELNRLDIGSHYGWPFCWGNQEVDPYLPAQPENLSPEEFCAETEAPVLMYTAHSSPLQMIFYTGDQFPEEYRNSAFVTLRGSWNANPAVGYKVIWIEFDDAGEPVEIHDFMTGFLIDDEEPVSQFARLVGLAIMSDGSLLVGDDTNGVIYRVMYNGDES